MSLVVSILIISENIFISTANEIFQMKIQYHTFIIFLNYLLKLSNVLVKEFSESLNKKIHFMQLKI